MFDEEQNYAIPQVDISNALSDVPVASDYITTINDVHSPNISNPAAIDWASADPWHDMGSPTGLDPTDTADDRFRREAAANLKRNTGNTSSNNPTGNLGVTFGGGGGGGSVPSAPVLNTRMPLNRIPSGSVYAPDLSAYNDSSLFNYTGPGGASEYTYGQNLPYQGAGYNIWGSPTDVANPYFWGQFANTAETGAATGPADAAINMPAVEMPAGVPSTNTTTGGGNVGGGTGPGGQDLTYAQTLAEMGINPADAPSTTFPSPGDNTAPVINPGMTLAERQRAQIGADKYDAMVAQANAWDRQMREGQLGSGFKGEEELNRDVQKTIFDNEYFDTPILGNDTVSATPYVGNAGRGNIVEQPGDRLRGLLGDYSARTGTMFDNEYFDKPILGNDIVTTPTEDLLSRKVSEGMALNQAELMAWGKMMQDKFDAQEAMVPINQHFLRNQAEYSAPLFQGDALEAAVELDYPGAKKVTDFVDAIDGDSRAYKKILAEDDVIKTTGHSRAEGLDNETARLLNMQRVMGDYGERTGNQPSVPNTGRGTIVEQPGDRYNALVGKRTAYESPGSRAAYADFMNLPDDSYAKELHLGQIQGESTSNLTAIELADNFDAIDAKYEGSTTEESGQNELQEVVDAITSSYSELSTRDLIKPSLTYLEDKAVRHSASSDLFAQNERQQLGSGPGLGNTLAANAMDSQLRNQLSNVPVATPSGPPTRQAIPRIEPSIWDKVADSFSRNFSLFGR